MARLNGQGKREWDLSGRKLKSLTQTPLLSQGQAADKVDLQRNKLKQFTGLSKLLCLRELNLSRNELVEFPAEVGSLLHLEKLYLNQNNIKSIPEGVFSQLAKLHFLKLSTNRLDKLPADLSQCRNLTYLNVSKNCLRDLQPLVGLCKLKELFVEKNNVTEVPPQLFLRGSMELSMFKATGNPLRCPPEEVCEGSVEDIRIYFQLMEESPATNNTTVTVKTMFLGSSMAGKSTLSRSLALGRPIEVREDDRTEGIEISQLHSQGVRFLFWDFAGQEEYYLTHHVFITPRALVILAVDLASYNIRDPQSFDEKVRFWINNIQLRVPDSVVLLVGTHSDKCQGIEEILEKKRDIERKVKDIQSERKEALELKKKYLADSKDPSVFADQMEELTNLLDYNFQVLDLVTINSKNKDEIFNFTEHILKQTKDQTFPCAERTLPKSYEEVEKAIQDLSERKQIPQHGIISYSDLSEMLKSVNAKLKIENLNSILRYLHRIGIIVWYEDVSALHETVFIKPSILISLFKTIVRPDLEQKLSEIPRQLLLREKLLGLEKNRWVDEFKGKATLHHVAMRILISQELQRLGLEEEDLVSEVVGTQIEDGIVLNLLQHFEVCLPTRLGSPLDPEAPEFFPEMRWYSSNAELRDLARTSLFPCYLQDNQEVNEMWGEDRQEDLNVRVFLLPNIPHGFFHPQDNILDPRLLAAFNKKEHEKEVLIRKKGKRPRGRPRKVMGDASEAKQSSSSSASSSSSSGSSSSSCSSSSSSSEEEEEDGDHLSQPKPALRTRELHPVPQKKAQIVMAKQEPPRKKRGRKLHPPELKAFQQNRGPRQTTATKDSPTDFPAGVKKPVLPASFTFMGFPRSSARESAGPQSKSSLSQVGTGKNSSSHVGPGRSLTSALPAQNKSNQSKLSASDGTCGTGLGLKAIACKSPGVATLNVINPKALTTNSNQQGASHSTLGAPDGQRKTEGAVVAPLQRVSGKTAAVLPAPKSPVKAASGPLPLNRAAQDNSGPGNGCAPVSSLRNAANPARKASVAQRLEQSPATPGGQLPRKSQPGGDQVKGEEVTETGATAEKHTSKAQSRVDKNQNQPAEVQAQKERSASKDGKQAKMSEMSTGEDESSSDSDQDPAFPSDDVQDLSFSVQTSHDWKPPRNLIEHVFVTDVTANLVTVTVKESPTSVGFFSLRNY